MEKENFDTKITGETMDDDNLADMLKEIAMESTEIPEELKEVFRDPTQNTMYFTKHRKFNNLIGGSFDPKKVYGIIQTDSVYFDDIFFDIAMSSLPYRTRENQYKMIISINVTRNQINYIHKNKIDDMKIIHRNDYHFLFSKKHKLVLAIVNPDIDVNNIRKIILDVDTILDAYVEAVFIDSNYLVTLISNMNDMVLLARNMGITIIMNFVVDSTESTEALEFPTTDTKLVTSGLFQFIEGTDVCIAMTKAATEYGVEVIAKLVKHRGKPISHQTAVSIEQLYTGKLKKVLDDYQDLLLNFSDDRVFGIKADEDYGLEIIERCSSLYSHRLSKQDCFDLSELFKKLGDELTIESMVALNVKEPTNEAIDKMGTILGEHYNPKRIWFGYDNSNYTITCVYDKESDIKLTKGVTILSTNNPGAIDFITSVFISEADTPFIVFPKEFLILRYPTLSYGDIISFKDIDENDHKGE